MSTKLQEEKKMIHYGVRHPLRGMVSRLRHQLCSPNMYLKSHLETVDPNPLGCMLCVYDEQETIVDAIKTTMDAVDFYVVVDKNGETISAIEESGLEIEAEYHVKTDLTLAEARAYALKHLQRAEWILIQDGDEFYTKKMSTIPRDRPNIYYRTRKNLIYPDRTMPLYHSGFHSFLFHNNGTVRVPFPNDIPHMTGRAIHLPDVVIWNYHHNKRPKPQTVHYTPNLGPLPAQLEAII